MTKWFFLLLLGLNFAKAQVYAPDTTFRFQNATIAIPSYKILSILSSDTRLTIAKIEQPTKEANLSSTSTALLDSTGKIVDKFGSDIYLSNSLSKNGFWIIPSNGIIYNDSTIVVDYYDLNTLKRTPHYLRKNTSDYSLQILKIENNCMLIRQGEGNYYIYDVKNGKLLFTINTKHLIPAPFSNEKYTILEIRIDKAQNFWVMVMKEMSTTNANLQLYKVKANENLDKNKLVFEKTEQGLGTAMGKMSIWQQAKFFGDTIVFKRNKDRLKPREIIMISLNGKILPFKAELPLVNNDPNTYYGFFDSFKMNYLTFRLGENRFYFVDSKGKVTFINLLNTYFTSIHIENDIVSYVDNQIKLHELAIETLTPIKNERKIPVGAYEAGINYLQSLNNYDYWVGHKNPYASTQFFVKFRQGKPTFRYGKEVSKVFYLGGNDLLLQTDKGEKVMIDGFNKESYLSKIEGDIVNVDTLYQNIYTNSYDGKVYRYSYNEERDYSFDWEGGALKSDMVITDNKKIYYNGSRFNFDGKIDRTFQAIIFQKSNLDNAYKLKKIWNSVFTLNAFCAEGCRGEVYLWEKSENQPKKLDNSLYEYLYRYILLTGRGSLLLDGFQKILPNLKVDSSFKVKGSISGNNTWSPNSYTSYKPIDILPNHDLLGVFKNQIYRFSQKNNLWVEIRNLPSRIELSDSLIKYGLELDVFSSDNSIVELQIISSPNHIAYLNGNKLFFYGNEGLVTISAKSIKGGQPYEATFWVNLPFLKQSVINILPADTSLYVDFKPFPISYSSDIGVPLEISISGKGGYLKDGVLYPTKKPGFIKIKVSHTATSTHNATSKEVYYQVQRYQQTVSTEKFFLKPSDFPFKIPTRTSANLPIGYTIKDYYGLSTLFYISSDSIYLNPDYRTFLEENNWSERGSNINFYIEGTQSGNIFFEPVGFNFPVEFDYWSENIDLQRSNIFPNPFKDYFYITTPVTSIISDVYLCDTNGRKIVDLVSDKNNYLWIANTSFKQQKGGDYFRTNHIPDGNYLLVFSVNGKREIRKIVK